MSQGHEAYDPLPRNQRSSRSQSLSRPLFQPEDVLSCSPPLCVKARTGGLVYFRCCEPKSWTTPEVTLSFLRLDCDLLLRALSLISRGQGGQLELDRKSGSGPTSPISDRLSQRRIRATLATSSNTGSPVRLLRVANSTMKVPIPAVQVTGVSPGFTP